MASRLGLTLFFKRIKWILRLNEGNKAVVDYVAYSVNAEKFLNFQD